MIYETPKRIQIGDIEAFKKMIEDAINHKKIFAQSDEQQPSKKCHAHYSHNDTHYQFAKKIKVDSADKA